VIRDDDKKFKIKDWMHNQEANLLLTLEFNCIFTEITLEIN